MVNKNNLYLKSSENNGISQIRDILNENGEFLKQPFSKLYKYKKAFQHDRYKKLSTVK